VHPGGLPSLSQGTAGWSGPGLGGSGVVTGPIHPSVCPGSHGGNVVDGASPGTQLGGVPVVPGGHVFGTFSCGIGVGAGVDTKGSGPVTDPGRTMCGG
jgi:hypothetical protein